jgi:hypothetical protein
MKIKDIQQLLGIPASTFNDWKKPGHEKHNLALLLSAMSAEEAAKLVAIADKKALSKPVMLMSTVNCSIGNKSKHLKMGQIKALLSGKLPQTPAEKYALKIIKTEATAEEIMYFADYYKLPKTKVESVLHGH